MKETQADKILKALQEKNGEWINGRYFNDTLHITQFHARIFELQKRGHIIEASAFTDQYGFKSYRLMSEALAAPKQWWLDPKIDPRLAQPTPSVIAKLF